MTKWTIKDFHPQYWPTWLAMGLLYAVSHLPYAWQLAIGRQIGKILYLVLPRRRRIVNTNLTLCFPELNEHERTQLNKNVFASAGMAVVETGMSWWWSADKLKKLYTLEGSEHIKKAQAQGRGILAAGMHFTCMDICGRMASLEHSFGAFYREQNNPIIDKILKYKRHRDGIRPIHRHDVRGMIKGLKQGDTIWFTPDQDFGRKHSVFAPFFGIPAATITTMNRISKTTNAVVLPLSLFRLDNNQGYKIVVHPPLEDFPKDELSDATRINAHIEQEIRQHPEQYLWLHRRFKTRPEGEDKIY